MDELVRAVILQLLHFILLFVSHSNIIERPIKKREI